MTRYMDGFVIPITTALLYEYPLMAKKAAIIWKNHGAFYCW